MSKQLAYQRIAIKARIPRAVSHNDEIAVQHDLTAEVQATRLASAIGFTKPGGQIRDLVEISLRRVSLSRNFVPVAMRSFIDRLIGVAIPEPEHLVYVRKQVAFC